MSAERSPQAWNAVQRRGQDLASRLAHGFSFLLRSHPVGTPLDPSAAAAAAREAGGRLARAGAELVEQLIRRFPVPFRLDEGVASADWVRADLDRRRKDEAVQVRGSCGGKEFGLVADRFGDRELRELEEEDGIGFDYRHLGNFGKPQGSINVTSTYDSRTNNMESSLVARGDLWRAEASHGSSTSRNESSPLFLVQLGPVLFVRDTTLLFPVHLSKQHLLWYGFDQKSGTHSLCPALWSKHRRWLLMSMICLNPFACSFMDMQLPNGQLTYVAGEGLTSSAFLPIFGGLLQAQAQYPRDIRVSFSFKNRCGTRITPVVQWPDKSFSLGLVQTVSWKRSSVILRPSMQFSICPTFGGRHRGLHAELIHSVNEKFGVVCGYSYTAHPSAFASVSMGRSKLNGNIGSSGLVIRVETPLGNNCSSTLNSMVSRRDNRLLFARQGAASQANYMQPSRNQRRLPLNSSCCGCGDTSRMHSGEPKSSRQAQINDSTLCSSTANPPMIKDSVLSSCDAPKFARDAKIEKQQQTSNCTGMAWSPRMDVAESGASYVVTVELAGVSIADIQVEMDDQNLRVTGERSIRHQTAQIGFKTSNPRYQQREILQGLYRVAWPLPNDVNKDAVAAKFVDGFLHITLPKL